MIALLVLLSVSTATLGPSDPPEQPLPPKIYPIRKLPEFSYAGRTVAAVVDYLVVNADYIMGMRGFDKTDEDLEKLKLSAKHQDTTRHYMLLTLALAQHKLQLKTSPDMDIPDSKVEIRTKGEPWKTRLLTESDFAAPPRDPFLPSPKDIQPGGLEFKR